MSEGHWIAHLGQFNVNVDTVVTMWITMGILIVFAFLATRKMSIIPTKLQAVAEGILGAFVGLTSSCNFIPVYFNSQPSGPAAVAFVSFKNR